MKTTTILILLLMAVSFQSFGKDVKKPGINSAKAYETFFNQKNLHELELLITGDEWQKLLSGYKSNRFEDKYYRADLRYHGVLGDTIFKNVGFRIRGNTSRRIPQLDSGQFQKAHFKIKLNETFDLGKGSVEYKLKKKASLARQEILNLKWTRENELYRPEGDNVDVSSDRSQIREMFALETLNKGGVTAAHAAPAALMITIDGVKHNFGIYYIIENIDPTFLKNKYGKEQSKGNLYKCMWGFYNASLEQIKDSNWIGLKNRGKDYFPPYDLRTNRKKFDNSGLYAFIKNLNERKGDSLKAYLDNNFEIDRFIRHLALSWLLGNPDDYRSLAQNYYLYFNPKGKIDFIPYDYDHCLGAEWNPGTELLGIYDTMDYPKEWDPWGSRNRPLVFKVLEIKEYKALYEKYLLDFINPQTGIYRYQDFKNKFTEINHLCRPFLKNEMHQAEWMELDETTRSTNPKNGGVSSVKYYMELKTNRVYKDLKVSQKK